MNISNRATENSAIALQMDRGKEKFEGEEEGGGALSCYASVEMDFHFNGETSFDSVLPVMSH